jgi:uncharacterized protein YbjT (DUF2867 family)
LLAAAQSVRTLTGHPGRPDPFAGQVEVKPLAFDRPAELARSLEGVVTLYNTYWIRFAYGGATFERAVRDTLTLFDAARQAGVHRIVHLSITGADPASRLPYFRGKGRVEAALRASGVSHAILRPTVIFGPEDILINNIAWLVRRFPVFAVPGDGRYPVQPVYVDDVAAIAVDAGRRPENLTLDAVGPETYAYADLVRLVGRVLDRPRPIVHVPPALARLAAAALGLLVRDVVLTGDEIAGLMAGLLVSPDPPTGTTRLSRWLREHAATLGTRWASELARHYR